MLATFRGSESRRTCVRHIRAMRMAVLAGHFRAFHSPILCQTLFLIAEDHVLQSSNDTIEKLSVSVSFLTSPRAPSENTLKTEEKSLAIKIFLQRYTVPTSAL